MAEPLHKFSVRLTDSRHSRRLDRMAQQYLYLMGWRRAELEDKGPRDKVYYMLGLGTQLLLFSADFEVGKTAAIALSNRGWRYEGAEQHG